MNILESESLQVTQHVCWPVGSVSDLPFRVSSRGSRQAGPASPQPGAAFRVGETPELARLRVVACVSPRSRVTVSDWDAI